MSLCQSGFEREMLARLLALGYRVQPQVKVGPFSIDLVVEGRDDRRLAIELDGDQYHGPERWADDLARQRVMERVGWRFWRCWGSSFRLDPEGCLDDLIRALGSLGIEPMSAREASTVWTEFRTTAPPETVGFDQLAATPDAVLTPASAGSIGDAGRGRRKYRGNRRPCPGPGWRRYAGTRYYPHGRPKRP